MIYTIKKGSAELISLIIIIVVAGAIALVIATNNSKDVHNTNSLVQSEISGISLKE